MQLLAGCINKGDLSGLHNLRWEPPADSSPVPASKGAQKLPPAESIIHVPPLDPGKGMGHLRGPGATPCTPQAAGKAVSLAGEEKQESRCTGQKGTAALGKSEGAMTMPPGPRFPALQVTMQSRRTPTAQAQSLQQQARSKHKPGPTPGPPLCPPRMGFRKHRPQGLPRATASLWREATPGSQQPPARSVGNRKHCLEGYLGGG